MHGWGIGQRIRQMSSGVLEVNQGSLYPALQRLEKQGLIGSDWGTTDNNRRARYYRLTPSGRRTLGEEINSWRRFADGPRRGVAEHLMRWVYAARARLRLLLFREEVEQRMDEEFRFHLDMETERLVREAGVDPRESASTGARRPSAASKRTRTRCVTAAAVGPGCRDSSSGSVATSATAFG